MYNVGDLLITTDGDVLIIDTVLEPDGSELHSMLVFDVLACIEGDHVGEDLEAYIEWITDQPWYLLLDCKTLKKHWDVESFIDIETSV